MPSTTPTSTATASTGATRIPPHPPKSSLPPFRPPPLTPSFGIRTSHSRGSPRVPGGGIAARNRIPMPLSPQELPEKYKYAERRVRTAIIALPIAIVTSWVLYNRLVKGEERKVLVHRAAAE